MRILAFDVGDVRIGIAVSDPMGWTAQGIESYTRKTEDEDIQHIGYLIKQYSPEKIVIGLPKNMNGTLGPMADKVKIFASHIQDIYSSEIVMWDERLTTVAAERLMISADISRKKRRKSIDKLAAMYILQSYLDFLNNSKK